MTDGLGFSDFSGVPYPLWHYSPSPSPSPYPSDSAPPSFATHPVESYDPTQGGFDPMISHGSYHRSPADWSNNQSYGDSSRSRTPSSSFYADNSRPGNFGRIGEDSYKNMYSPGEFYPSRESSSDFVSFPTENFSERQCLDWVPCNSAPSTTVSSLADMLIRNSQEPFYKPIPPSGVYTSSNAFDETRPVQYHPGDDKPESMNAVSGPPVEPYGRVPSLPMSRALFDVIQTGIRLGDGRSFPSNSDVCSDAPVMIQPSLHGSSVEPVNFDVLLGYGEAAGHVKPLSENADRRHPIVGSPVSKSPRSSHPLQFNSKSSASMLKGKQEGSGVSSHYQRPNTFVSDSENGVSESSLKNAIEDLNGDDHRSWKHFVVSSEGPSAPTMFSMGSESCGTMKANNENAAQSAINYKIPSEGSANQHSEDVQASQKTCKLQEQLIDIMNKDKKTTLMTDLGIKGSNRTIADGVSTGQSPEWNLCDHGDFPSLTSSTRVSSVVNAMRNLCNLSEVLVYECFNNGGWLKPEQFENLDKVVDNLTKCLKKITGNKTTAGETSVPTQAKHISSPNVVNLNEASNVVAKDCQGCNVKSLDNFGFKEPVDKDKNEMTQSIKNILASNFLDGEENHPQTLLYKNLWLETEAALCSTTCMARYHRIQNEIGNLKLQSRDEPFLNPQKWVSIMNNVEQETTDSLIKHESNCGNNVVTMSNDAPESSRFNSDPVDAVLSLMSRSFTGGLEQENHGNLKPDAQIQQESYASTTEEKHNDVTDRFQILKHQDTKRKLKSQDCPDPDVGVIDRFQILKQRETNLKLESQNCSKIREDNQKDNLEASEMANVDRSMHMSDVIDRFQILKRREAEQVQKSLNSLDIDSDSDSDSDNDQPRNKTQMYDHLWSDSIMTIRGNSLIETCVVTEEPSASGGGYESPTSDWEHVLKDN